jgi:diapolycopene oxygenase
MTPVRNRKVIVIGAGLGGISAAISLAQQGYTVEVFEKNLQIGGKLNMLRREGYVFDLGPSILTLPHLFERLFTGSGRRMADYVSIRRVRPHWRNIFEDGSAFDFVPDEEAMSAELAKLGPGLDKPFRDFLSYSGKLYDLVNRGYFEAGLDSVAEFIRYYEPGAILKFDLFRTMHGGVARFIREPHLRDALDFFIKYVGSSAYAAPAFMNCLPTIQFRYDLWYVDGGMYNMAVGLGRLMEELGIRVNLGQEVTEIRKDGGRVSGITASGVFHPADIVVSNMEVIPATRELLKAGPAEMKRLERFEPACSGLVIDLGLDCRYAQLAHHNFFFSGDQKSHFKAVFTDKVLPHDPTLYVVASSRTDPTVAPAGCDGLKILPHIPPIDPARPLAPEDYRALRERVLDKLERMGLKDLRRHIVVEHLWTPVDIQREYYSNCGSIYGVVCDRWKNFAFKAPKQSARYPNLFFTGGSVNPGGGMPMVVLGGQNVCKRIVEWDRP